MEAILACYIILMLCLTLFVRVSSGSNSIQTQWFWGYKSTDPKILFGDNLFNILLFVPIGCLVGILAKNNKVTLSVLTGLFVSETIECSQLIWQRGTFDVDDLLNNTIGALAGGLIVVLVMVFRKKSKKYETHY